MRLCVAYAVVLVALAGCERAPDIDTMPQAHAYPALAAPCAAKPAAPPGDGVLQTADRLDVLVRAPTNYRADVAHPLLVVYAAAGMTPTASERLTKFTAAATRAGYLVAYARHIRPSRSAIRKLAQVPAAVAEHYCVDAARIYVTGHSDGGTTATALAVQPDSAAGIAGLAPSAAGFTGQDLAGFPCPGPRPVLVWHGAHDRLFPGWGREAAAWWAACNACAPAPPVPATGCVRYAGCTQPVHYCEGDYGHTTWPPDGAARTIAFFESIRHTK